MAVETQSGAARFAVMAAHRRSYDDPIVVAKGDAVTVGQADHQWPGWLWCTSATGKAGWVPTELLDRTGGQAQLRESYSATELTVQVDEIVQGYRELAGWIWCRRETGEEGWLPAANLRRIP